MSKSNLVSRVAFSLGLLLCTSPAWAAATIDTAQHSGVEGYPIGIFGTGFGASQGAGKVTILGADASITKWTDTVIEAVVPAATAGVGDLVVTASDATTAQSPFELYAIDPKFLVRPSDLVNLAFKKTFVLDGVHDDWAGDPTVFLGSNDGTHGASFTAPISIAVDLGSALSEDAWFSFFDSSDWYEGGSIPTAYTVDASADSTDGKNGSWATLTTVTDNKRKSRIHKVTLAGQHWIRLHVTASEMATFNLNEIRVYKRNASGTGDIDCIGIYGDSITFGDNKFSGPSSVHELIGTARNDGTVPATYIMGLIGAGTGVFTTAPNSIADALALTPDLHFFGIALGTNIDPNNKQNFITAVEALLAAGKVPILARMADTDTANGGFGTPEYKKQTIQEVDEVAAQYKLIPGPDLYTPFRQNLATYLSDGTHHSDAGGAVERQLWADTFMRAYESSVAPPEGGSGGTSGSGGASGGTATGGGTSGGAGGVSAGGMSSAGTTSSAGGATAAAGSKGSQAPDSSSSCGCRVPGSAHGSGSWLALCAALLAAAWRRRASGDV